MDEDRQQLKSLILDAERLMAAARAEGREIVSSAELQAKELVDAARQLYDVAETEAHDIRSDAAGARAAAEHQAQLLMDEAHEKQQAAIEQARTVTGDASHEQPTDATTDDRSVDEKVLEETSRRVDQMLRVARSEAKANADELVEQARRRAAQIDEDARRREEVAAKQHRALLLSMRDEQLAIRTRIAELRSDLRAAESAATTGDDIAYGNAPDVDDVDAREETRTETGEATPPDPVQPRTEAMPMRPLIPQPSSARNERLRQSTADGETDDDYAKAVKRFRRRA